MQDPTMSRNSLVARPVVILFLGMLLETAESANWKTREPRPAERPWTIEPSTRGKVSVSTRTSIMLEESRPVLTSKFVYLPGTISLGASP